MILVLSLELVKNYRVCFFFLFVDALRSFRVSRGAHPAVRRWLRPPAVRGLTIGQFYCFILLQLHDNKHETSMQ